MSRQFINPETMAKPQGIYTHVVKVGPFVYLSGQASVDPDSGEHLYGSFDEQMHLTFDNIQKALASVGATLKDVVKVQAHLADINDFGRFNELYATYFTPPYPARTTVGSDLGGLKVEIDLVAYIE